MRKPLPLPLKAPSSAMPVAVLNSSLLPGAATIPVIKRRALPSADSCNDFAQPDHAPVMDILFDSGAFSAWKLGKPIDLDTYCEYLLKNRHWMGTYIALDEIIPEDPERAAANSYRNYIIMRERGLRPMPVFHAKEDIKWLYKLIDAGADYIGFAGLSLNSHSARMDWYASFWDKITDNKGLPLIKAHALGEGRFDALSRFPWYSADSTSWIYTSQINGQIPMTGGKSVSMRNDYLNDSAKPDMDALFEEDDVVFQTMLDHYSVDRRVFEQRRPEAAIIRTYLALRYYLAQEQAVNALCPINHKKPRLFAAQPGYGKLAPIHIPNIRYYSVMGNNPIAWATLAFAKAHRGLISYFYVAQGEKVKQQKEYAESDRLASSVSGIYGSRSYFRKLEDFVYDPHGACSTQLPMKKSFDVLKEYVK